MLIPRLRGIVKYVHTLNSGMVSGVCLLGSACNQAQIPILLLEETALYMQYADAPQRHLWQMYIGVPAKQHEKVLNLARENGFTVECYSNTAVARQGVTRQIVIRSVEDNSYLWDGAEKLKKGNAVFLCPTAATMLLEEHQRTFRALTKPNPRVSLVRWSMDMKILLERLSDEDWIQAKKIALAKDLLDKGADVTEACYECGFNDCSYFIRVFKKYVGMTPLTYKNSLTRAGK